MQHQKIGGALGKFPVGGAELEESAAGDAEADSKGEQTTTKRRSSAMEAEAAKGRMEAELLQVSKIAASMESRLREAQAAADSVRTAAATADRRAYEVCAALFMSRIRSAPALVQHLECLPSAVPCLTPPFGGWAVLQSYPQPILVVRFCQPCRRSSASPVRSHCVLRTSVSRPRHLASSSARGGASPALGHGCDPMFSLSLRPEIISTAPATTGYRPHQAVSHTAPPQQAKQGRGGL